MSEFESCTDCWYADHGDCSLGNEPCHKKKTEFSELNPMHLEIESEARIDMPGTTTIKIKRQIPISATRCLVCGVWECPDFNDELYDAVITGETTGLCESCKKAVLWAKEHMNDSN